jgi:hypothetical protein
VIERARLGKFCRQLASVPHIEAAGGARPTTMRGRAGSHKRFLGLDEVPHVALELVSVIRPRTGARWMATMA